MKPSLLRRWATSLLRKLAGAQRSIFKGAELSRLQYDWITSPLSADQEMMTDFLRLRARARELRRNHPLIRQYLKLLASNVVGADGFKFQARVRNRDGQLNKAINAKIEAAWADWSTVVTVDGRMGLVDLQIALIRALATDGEILVRKIRNFAGNRYRFALQTFDPDQLDHQFFRPPADGQNEIRLGVELDQWGAPVAYHFWDRHPNDLITVAARRRLRIPANEIIHLYDPDRANASRGVTWFNSIVMPAKMLDGYIEAEVVAARTAAAKMGFFEWKDAGDFEPPKEGEKLSMEASPGSFEQLPPGLQFKEWNPQHPAVAFPNFLKAMQRWIGAGLGVSYNALANDLEGVNYSSMRSGLLIERDEWKRLQSWWARKFLMPIYGEWLEFAELSGMISLDSRDWQLFMQVRFLPRGWQWVDPLKDTNASIAAVDNALASRTRVLAEQGDDFEEIVEELKDEQDMIDQAGLKLTGLGVGPGSAAGDDPAKEGAEGESGNQSGRARARMRLIAQRSLTAVEE